MSGFNNVQQLLVYVGFQASSKQRRYARASVFHNVAIYVVSVTVSQKKKIVPKIVPTSNNIKVACLDLSGQCRPFLTR